MRFGLCLDFVIGSCESLLLQMYCNPLTLMFAPLFVECLLRDLNFMFRDNVFAEPLQCRNGVKIIAQKHCIANTSVFVCFGLCRGRCKV